MKCLIYILSLLLIVIAACNDEKGTKMDIVETGCANEQDDFYKDTGDYQHAVTTYLEDNNIRFIQLEKSITIQVRFVWLARVLPVT